MFWRTFSTGAAFILNILFARYFSASVSGWVFYLFTVFAFIIQLISLSLESGVGYYAARNNTSDARLLGFSFVWSVAATTAAGLLFVPVSHALGYAADYPLYYPVLYILGNMLISFGNSFCYSKYQFVLPGMVSVAINIALILALVMVPVAHRDYFIPVYFASFLLQGIVLFVLIVFRMKVFPSLNISRENVAGIFRYSLQAFTGNLLFLLMNRVDYFFVKRYCSLNELGNYIQVSKIAQLFFILPSIIASVLFPIIAGGVRPEIAERVRTISVVTLMVYSALLLILIVSGGWLFPWLYGADFNKMYWPFLLLVPGIAAISSLYPYTAYYAAVNRIGVNIAGSVASVVVIVAGDLALIPAYGIAAAAAVTSVGYIVFQLYVMRSFRKEFRLPLKKLFTLNRDEFGRIIQNIRW